MPPAAQPVRRTGRARGRAHTRSGAPRARRPGGFVRLSRHNQTMTAAGLQHLAEELGLDVVGAAPASAYTETEQHIRDRRGRGLFADMRFTMAQPETSCHPERLLPGARTVISAAHCYWTEEPPLEPGD